MSRKINFNAGPAGLPLSVLEQAQSEFTDYHGTGMSIVEHSHRGKAYEAAHNEALALFSELLELPSNYAVLALQGGASLQFAMLPLNFLPAGRSADYIVTGHWAKIAFSEGGRVGTVRKAADSAEADKRYVRLPKAEEISIDPKAAYVHMTSNNTIFGTQWHELPDAKGVALVSDMSSDILSRPIEAERHALIYAGAQKNLGPAGLTVVALNKDWLKDARADIPDILRYQKHADANSLYHTPPSFAVYLFGLSLKWIKAHGGASGMEARNQTKSSLLYGALDRLSGFYSAPVEKASRSRMNVVFRAPTPALEDAFCAEAEKAGMTGLKGHRSTGGVRASLYNAVSPEDVKTLVSFMEDFAKRNG
ncbi:MAG TPA: 3-phosphoserine/phosphohydroxythreonine transaminase [Elusimicrobiota bacterium]|jgi:phosphoserine aminotransferase|nr:3-phosphoserine/phosphohydroxythreonine transaminase [Elusimicrobiota bacterium]